MRKRYIIQVFSALFLLVCIIVLDMPVSARAQVANTQPIGFLDSISTSSYCASANGWAVDPDTVTQSIKTNFYVDGKAGQGGVFAGSTVANLPRPDVSATYPGNHGYSFILPSQFSDGKSHTLYAYGIDTTGGANPLLSGTQKSFTLPVPPPIPPVPSTQGPFQIGNEEVLYTYADIVAKGLYNWPDGTFGIIKNGSTMDWYASGNNLLSESIGVIHRVKTTGPLNDPASSKQSSPAITGLPAGTYQYLSNGPVYTDPATGYILAFTHLERHSTAGPQYFWASIGLIISKDGGRTFSWVGEIIQHNVPFTATFTTAYEAGNGTYALINPPDDPANTYFYVYILDFAGNASGISVSRAKVSDVMNNAANATNPIFYKYYNGAWSQPGLGGLFSNITASNIQAVPDSIHYNTVLNKYLLALRDYSGGGGFSTVTLLTSSNPIDFTTATKYIIENSPANQSVYPTLVGLGNNPQTQSDNSFYIYYLAWPTCQSPWQSGTHLARRLVIIPPSQPAFTGEYYTSSRSNKFNKKIFTRQDNTINFDWGYGSPDPRLPTNNFAVRWTGAFSVPTAGISTFSATTNDGMRVWVDSNLLLNKWFDQQTNTYTFAPSLTAGNHTIVVEYYEKTDAAAAKLSWH